MNQTVNTKEFSKVNGLVLANVKDLDLWYKTIVAHGFTHGVFIPPYETLELHNIHGKCWSSLPEDIVARENLMSSQILLFLDQPDRLPKSPTFLRDSVLECEGDCYSALYNIMIEVHPAFDPKTIIVSPPEQTTTQ